jgi:YHS domain-containing protein
MVKSGEDKLAIDVVCKMNVDEKSAKFKSEHKSREYYFCCAGCKKSFDGNPAKFV